MKKFMVFSNILTFWIKKWRVPRNLKKREDSPWKTTFSGVRISKKNNCCLIQLFSTKLITTYILWSLWYLFMTFWTEIWQCPRNLIKPEDSPWKTASSGVRISKKNNGCLIQLFPIKFITARLMSIIMYFHDLLDGNMRMSQKSDYARR